MRSYQYNNTTLLPGDAFRPPYTIRSHSFHCFPLLSIPSPDAHDQPSSNSVLGYIFMRPERVVRYGLSSQMRRDRAVRESLDWDMPGVAGDGM